MGKIKVIPASSIEVKNKVSDSIFWGNIKHVESKEEAKIFIEKIKNKYYDASHNVSAYLIEKDNENIEYYDDDGEPSKSSGPPVLKNIKGSNLVDTVIVVTRYFGGTKLGIGGLIRAYGNTAKITIKKAKTKKLKLYYYSEVKTNYDHVGNVLGQIEAFDAKIKDTRYSDNGISVYFYIAPESYNQLKEKLVKITGNNVKFSIKDKIYL